MKVGFVYLDALAEGGYPRDVRRLAGQLAGLGASVSLVANPGTRIHAIDGVELVRPDELDRLASTLDILHIWGVFLPRQFWISRHLGTQVRPVVSPMGHLINAHVQRRSWKKVPYLMAIRRILAGWRTVAHVFSPVELEGAKRYLRPVAEFEGSLGVFPAPPGAGRLSGHVGDYILFLGRNDIYQKGLDLLLAGYAAAVEQGLNIPLRIAGQPVGNSETILHHRIASLGLASRTELLGEVSEGEKWELLGRARCLVFLSRWDGPPRPIREAIAVGTPVLVTPGTNLADVVDGSGAGLAVEFRADDVARGLLRSTSDKTAHEWIGGALRLRDTLSWSAVARSYLDGYESVVNSR